MRSRYARREQRTPVRNSMDAEQDRAIAVRKSILDCLYDTGGGHYGGSLSVVDILLVLARDRLLLSKGHAAVALYSV